MNILLIILGIYFIIQPFLGPLLNRRIKSDSLEIFAGVSFWLVPVGIFIIIGQLIGVN